MTLPGDLCSEYWKASVLCKHTTSDQSTRMVFKTKKVINWAKAIHPVVGESIGHSMLMRYTKRCPLNCWKSGLVLFQWCYFRFKFDWTNPKSSIDHDWWLNNDIWDERVTSMSSLSSKLFLLESDSTYEGYMDTKTCLILKEVHWWRLAYLDTKMLSNSFKDRKTLTRMVELNMDGLHVWTLAIMDTDMLSNYYLAEKTPIGMIKRKVEGLW